LSHEYTHFLPALRQLGHEVGFLDSGPGVLVRDYSGLNRDLVQLVERTRPDILLSVLTAAEIWSETIGLIRKRYGVLTINWGTDDNWRYGSFTRYMARLVDVYVTTYRSVAGKLCEEGIDNVIVSQWGAASDQCFTPLSAGLCDRSVVFIGSAYSYRRRWIQHLMRSGVDVTCFGYGWPLGPVPESEIAGIIRRAAITLNFSGSCAFWQGTLTPKGKQIKARMFEVPALGGFLLSEAAPELCNYFEPGREIDTFIDRRDLVAKVKYYQSHPEERDAIAWAAHQRTTTSHLYEMRFRSLLQDALRFRKPATGQQDVPDAWAMMGTSAESPRETATRATTGSTLALTSIDRLRRRLVFEASWRLRGIETYSASGWPSRWG
jgi:spore maturation protein CgeB